MKITFDVQNDAEDQRIPVNVSIELDGEKTEFDGQLRFTPYELVAMTAALNEAKNDVSILIAASEDNFVIAGAAA